MQVCYLGGTINPRPSRSCPDAPGSAAQYFLTCSTPKFCSAPPPYILLHIIPIVQGVGETIWIMLAWLRPSWGWVAFRGLIEFTRRGRMGESSQAAGRFQLYKVVLARNSVHFEHPDIHHDAVSVTTRDTSSRTVAMRTESP